jgi:hypothetical protein
MKRIAIAMSILAALAFATAAIATGTITGKYTTTITAPASVAGRWTLDFKTNGTGTVAFDGQLTGNVFTVKGSKLTAPGGKGHSCPNVGTYRIHLAGKHLTFTVIKDECTVGRKLVLPGHTYTKVG